MKNLTFQKYNLEMGRMICSSKSYYITKHPGNLVIFNANVVTEKQGKIWYGDLDLAFDAAALNQVAAEIGEKLYVLREDDCRFKNEKRPIKELIACAVWSTQ